MTKKRTFIDTGVLIAAARGQDEVSLPATNILDDPTRLYISSDFIRLEVLPKAVYHKNKDEVAFYLSFFDSVDEVVETSKKLVADAQVQAESYGLSALDALHIVAALASNSDELVTTEKPSKPMFRNKNIKVTSINPNQ